MDTDLLVLVRGDGLGWLRSEKEKVVFSFSMNFGDMRGEMERGDLIMMMMI